MARRLRGDLEAYEMRGAAIRVARKAYLCDEFGCERALTAAIMRPEVRRIQPGDQYAHISTGLKICALHYLPTDVEDVTP
jgi:hypothetical protein